LANTGRDDFLDCARKDVSHLAFFCNLEINKIFLTVALIFPTINREPNGSLLWKMKTNAVFRALADPSRRKLLDRLHEKNGQTLGDLCRGLNMTRQAVAKHLAILRKANLVSWKREGRERLHFINPVPINEIAERWINKFEYPRLSALSNLKKRLEGDQQDE
jgi:DNA-binding transcriptional ArsR family regulator